MPCVCWFQGAVQKRLREAVLSTAAVWNAVGLSTQTEGKAFFFCGNTNTGRSLCRLRDVNIKTIDISQTLGF